MGSFLVEGILKFLYPNELAAGRFAKIGIPDPQVLGPLVGGAEVICGALVLAGLFTRLAAIPLLIDITVAIISTKLPILLGHGLWHFSLPKLAHYGFLSMIHEARTDFSMWLGFVFPPHRRPRAARRRWLHRRQFVSEMRLVGPICAAHCSALRKDVAGLQCEHQL